jgi:pimeloyl-ACP methyl ester carboxylesterase
MKSRLIMILAIILAVPLCIIMGILGPKKAIRGGLRRLERTWLLTTGRLVDVGGYRLHVERRGKGRPIVIMDNGLCQPMSKWGTVPAEVAKLTQVVTYDRAFLGFSDQGPMPRTSQQIVKELHMLLTKLHISGPLVLVGHSFGCLNLRLFASKYPDSVAGMVLVEAAHEDQVSRMVDILPPEYARVFLESQKKENCEHVDLLESAAQIRGLAPLRRISLIVITARLIQWPQDWPAKQLDKARFEMQEDLVRLVPNAAHIIAEKSGHFIQLDQPTIVIGAIRKVVEEVRGQYRSILRSDDSER